MAADSEEVVSVGAMQTLASERSWPEADIRPVSFRVPVSALTQADGVGPKLALRLVTELKDKVPAFGKAPIALHGAKAATGAMPNSLASDAVSALVNLGYRRAEAFGAVAAAGRSNPQAKLDELIRLSLGELSHGEKVA